MKKKNYLWILVPAFCVMSCETFLEGMGQGLQGFNSYQSVGSPGGYQVMPGGFVRDTSKDYLLDPRYAMQQVLQQEQQEYQAANVTVQI